MIMLLIGIVAIGFICVEAAIKDAAEQASRDAAQLRDPPRRHRERDYTPEEIAASMRAYPEIAARIAKDEAKWEALAKAHQATQKCAPFTPDEQAAAKAQIARALGRQAWGALGALFV